MKDDPQEGIRNMDIRALKEDFERCKSAIGDKLEVALKEIEIFRFEYNCDLDRIDMQIIYTDLRSLRGWRNRLAEILSVALRSQHRIGSILNQISRLSQNVVDESLIKNVKMNVNLGWASQERLADAELSALGSRQLEVVVRNFYEYVKVVVKILNDKRVDLRDAYQEVQAIQALLTLSMGTAD